MLLVEGCTTMITIPLSTEDLTKVRLAPSPLWETVASFGVLLHYELHNVAMVVFLSIRSIADWCALAVAGITQRPADGLARSRALQSHNPPTPVCEFAASCRIGLGKLISLLVVASCFCG